jgi:transcriptional regulator with XRE-family HTH domain
MTEKEWREIFSNRLRKIAYARGFDNHKKLAEASGLTEATVSRYFNGKRTPNANNLIRLAKTLNCTVDELIMVEKYIH